MNGQSVSPPPARYEASWRDWYYEPTVDGDALSLLTGDVLPVREDRITQADIEDAQDVLWRSGLGPLDREQSYRLALSVCEALLKGGRRA